ncbi:hypothetical protein ACN9MF_17370 [Methylobacterium fujisawaense]|uniref:hypothetical protein n=1 Tax=Methylobacterium fujisawaense TaxID=107400 RepID=UPI003CF17E59
MAAEMPGQDGLRPGMESEAVLGPHEAVALVREQRIGHREALRIEGCDSLVGLGLLHPGAVALCAIRRGARIPPAR